VSAVLDAPVDALSERLGERLVAWQVTADGIPTAWVAAGDAPTVLADLKNAGYAMLYDLTAIDERHRKHRDGQPPADFAVVYHLLSVRDNADVRIKVALQGEHPSLPTATGVWTTANWYEREVWDLFGVRVEGSSATEGASRARDRDGAIPTAGRKAGCRAGGDALQAGRVGAGEPG